IGLSDRFNSVRPDRFSEPAMDSAAFADRPLPRRFQAISSETTGLFASSPTPVTPAWDRARASTHNRNGAAASSRDPPTFSGLLLRLSDLNLASGDDGNAPIPSGPS